MSHPLYEILKLLDDARLWYRLDRTRPDAILISVTAVSERFEISVLATGEVELSRFPGTEDVTPGFESVRTLIASHTEPPRSN
jgi:hypothetical protein